LSVEMAANKLLLKGGNRMAVVRSLCLNPGMSRADLSHALRLTGSTVTMLVRELLAEGWLMERDVVTTGDIGRRPTPLFINPRRLVLLGAEVGVGSVRVVATSVVGEVLAREVVGFDPDGSPNDCIDALSRALLGVGEPLDGPSRKIIGLGVGLPGAVDDVRGFLHDAPNLGWRDVPVGEMLARQLSVTALAGVPLYVHNEADAAAIGEIEFSAAPVELPLLYLSMNEGLGAGVAVRDKLLGGSRGLPARSAISSLRSTGRSARAGAVDVPKP